MREKKLAEGAGVVGCAGGANYCLTQRNRQGSQSQQKTQEDHDCHWVVRHLVEPRSANSINAKVLEHVLMGWVIRDDRFRHHHIMSLLKT
jgi:hypothetical protein